jgi:hypothetical protein
MLSNCEWVNDYIRDANILIQSAEYKNLNRQEKEKKIQEFIRLKTIERKLDGVQK